MTTFQDPPLHSRRAARQGERNAAYGQQPEQAPEPLTYATQNRPPLPQYDGPDFRARRTPESQNGEPEQPAAQERPEQEAPRFRRRDYSPEGRRVTRPAGAPDAEGRIDYQTQARAAVPVVPAPETPAAAPAEDSAPVIEQTLTRRQLRALREAHGADLNAESVLASRSQPIVVPSTAGSDVEAAEAVESDPDVEPIADAEPTPEAEAEVVDEAADVDDAEVVVAEVVEAPEGAADTSATSEAAIAAEPAPAPETASAPELSPFEALFTAPSTEVRVDGFAPDPIADLIAPTAADQPEPLVEPKPEARVAASPVAEASKSPAGATDQSEAPGATTATPSGHWSTQSELDDATQLNESTISRNVGAGSGVITTSALVLPTLPSTDYTALGTGEILVTGSIDLPRSLATSGAHPTQLDEHHLDHELDPGDHQVVSTDSQPVRAVRAVSSHTSTRNVIVAKKPGGNRALTALIVSAAAMAAVVVTLLVVGLVSGVL